MNMKNLENISKIKCFIFDYDGVLSDGKVYMLPDGEGLRCSSVKDGYAIHHAVRQGYRVAVISGGTGINMQKRLNYIGVKDVFLGASSKIDTFDDYLISNDLNTEEVLYMGDDIPDYEVMKKSGIAACPSDASVEIKRICHYISPFKGGNGCVRDVIEQVMKSQGKWMDSETAFKW